MADPLLAIAAQIDTLQKEVRCWLRCVFWMVLTNLVLSLGVLWLL